MVFAIIFIIVFIVCLIAVIKAIKDDNDWYLPPILLVLAFALCFGAIRDGYREPKHSVEKEYIEILLENKLDTYTLGLAEKYNKEVNEHNNYFCRFTIEDRSDKLIDIDYYIGGDK